MKTKNSGPVTTNPSQALLGSWRLLECEHRHSDGSVEYPFGPKPDGRLVYLPDGRMIVLIIDPARPKARSEQFFEAVNSELADAARGCVAYSGRWEIRGNEIVHHIEMSMFPNWIEKSLIRAFEMNDRRLNLTTAPFTINGVEYTAGLVWEKEI